MDAIHGVAEVHRPRSQRVGGPAAHMARQIRPSAKHFRWRIPFRPFALLGDGGYAAPGEAVASDPNPIPQRASTAEHQIKPALARLHDDRSGLLAALKRDHGA